MKYAGWLYVAKCVVHISDAMGMAFFCAMPEPKHGVKGDFGIAVIPAELAKTVFTVKNYM